MPISCHFRFRESDSCKKRYNKYFYSGPHKCPCHAVNAYKHFILSNGYSVTDKQTDSLEHRSLFQQFSRATAVLAGTAESAY